MRLLIVEEGVRRNEAARFIYYRLGCWPNALGCVRVKGQRHPPTSVKLFVESYVLVISQHTFRVPFLFGGIVEAKCIVVCTRVTQEEARGFSGRTRSCLSPTV